MEGKGISPRGKAKRDSSNNDTEQQHQFSDTEEDTTMMELPKAQEEVKKKRKRRPPLVPWKKPKDMPRRPLSAYNIFFKEQRETLMAQRKAAEEQERTNAAPLSGGEQQSKSSQRKSNKSVGIGFANLAKTIAANWKDLDDETRAPYEARAKIEKDRYNAEMLVWRAKQKEEKERAEREGPQPLSAASAAASSSAAAAGSRRMDIDPPRTSPGTARSVSSPLRHDVDPLPLESPKKTRRGYLDQLSACHHRQQDSSSSAFAPLHHSMSSLMGPGGMGSAASAGFHQQSALAAGRLGGSMGSMGSMGQSSMGGLGLGFMPGQSFPSMNMPAAGGQIFPQSFHESWPNMNMSPGMMGVGMGQIAVPSNNYPLAGEVELARRSATLSPQQHSSTPTQFQLQQQQQQRQQQQLQLQQNRRNTWSGMSMNGSSDTLGHHQATLRRNTNEREMMLGNANAVAPNTNPFPDSWFEPDEAPTVHQQQTRRQSEPPSSQKQQPETQPSSSTPKTYPETWFEVASEDPAGHDDEPIRYSPEGDLTGKLTGSSQHSKHREDFPTAPSLDKVGGLKESGSGNKSKDLKKPFAEAKRHMGGIRSLDAMQSSPMATTAAAGATSSSSALPAGAGARASQAGEGENQVVESSLHALGMQLDEETVDFLTRLRFGITNQGDRDSTDEDDQGL